MEIKSIEFEATDRVKRLREQIFKSKPKVCPERALIITKVYQEHEKEPILRKRAIALDQILRNISCPIFEDELIVGNYGGERRSCPVFPEMSIQWLEDELDSLSTREQDQFEITEEAKNKLRSIFPYWKGKTINDRIFAELPEDTKRARLESGAFSVGAHEDTGLGHVLMNHEKVLRSGFRGIINEIKAARNCLDLTKTENLSKDLFYEAAIICLEAGIAWANRYADNAVKQLENTKDEKRRHELKKIIEVCRHVPESPARDFHEALQCVWFVQLLAQLETDGASITVGRLDQFVYPYLKKDLEKGVSKADLQEILDCFWLKFAEMVKLYKLSTAQLLAGFPMGQNIIIGGIDENGMEAVNDLSYMCLDAHRHCRLNEPNFSVRVSTVTSEKFMRLVCENIKMGTGHPVVFNEEVGINSLLAQGIPLKEARNYAPIGCVENSVFEMWMRANGGYLSLGKLIELAIHGGQCQLTKKQVGPKTKPLKEMQCFNELLYAYKKQAEFFVRHLVIENNVIDVVNSEFMPIPFVSSLFDSCVESGKDVTAGGAKYNFTCPGLVGVANAGDSLEAVKKLVFDEKRIDADKLQEVLSGNFEGAENIRQMLINEAPKYGNDVCEVDLLARKAVDIIMDELDKYTNARGGRFAAGLTAITANISFGRLAGALPDGRKAYSALAEGASPMMGNDRSGPTASMKSVSRLDHTRLMKGIIYNQKFSLPVLDGYDRLPKFIQMLRGYLDLGGAQVQFNVVSKDTLLDAQKHPENYRDLVVRVAGYSAFFTELSKEVQDLIILRTEYSSI